MQTKNESEYVCEDCASLVYFCPEDYEFKEEYYPTVCPLCDMPITQMIKDVYKSEGLKETLRLVLLRLVNKLK